MKKEIAETQRDVRDLKFEKQVNNTHFKSIFILFCLFTHVCFFSLGLFLIVCKANWIRYFMFAKNLKDNTYKRTHALYSALTYRYLL